MVISFIVVVCVEVVDELETCPPESGELTFRLARGIF